MSERIMKDSGIEWIGQIPQTWEIERLCWHLIEINDKNDPIKTTDVLSLNNKGEVMPYEERGNQGNKSKDDYTEYKIAYPNTIVANSMNILIGSVGLCNYTGCVSPVYYVLKNNNDSNLRYYNYLMQTKEFQKELHKYANGIMEIRLRVSSNDIFKRKVPVPTLEEQNSIAVFLDAKISQINNAISKTKGSIEEYKKLKQSIITEAVTKGLNHDVEMKDSGNIHIGKCPKHWEIKKFKYIAKSLFKGNGISKEEVYEDGDINCVRYGEIYTKYNEDFDKCFSKTKLDNKKTQIHIGEGDILFSGTGELIEEIGKNVVYMGKEDCLAGGDIIVCKHTHNPMFLNYSLNSSYSQEQKSKGKAKLKVVHISASEIGNIVVPLPPREEQDKIAKYLKEKSIEFSRIISNKEKIIEELEQYKKSLIYEYVTGKKEVA